MDHVFGLSRPSPSLQWAFGLKIQMRPKAFAVNDGHFERERARERETDDSHGGCLERGGGGHFSTSYLCESKRQGFVCGVEAGIRRSGRVQGKGVL